MLIQCHDCEAVVDAKEIAEHKYEAPQGVFWDDGGREGEEITFTTRVKLVVCPRCDHPMLAYIDDSMGDFFRVYPPMDRNLHSSVPKPIKVAFTEARTCFHAKAFTAAAIMCRKALEGICSAHGVKTGTLAAELKKLKESGIIDSRLFEWAEELRTMGNEAAHDVAFAASREDAQDTLEFTEALIEYVFTYRDKFEGFKKRRTEAKSTAVQKQKGTGS
jgi:hypothetical protein